MDLVIRNTRDLVGDLKRREPWPNNFVEWLKPRDPRLLDELENTLNAAEDERPLQAFYEAHPYLLAIAFRPHNCWVFPRPRLGGGRHIPDFLYCDRDSLGYRWVLIELESPKEEATTQGESISAKCQHAVEQILDYRGWLRDNALAEQREYPNISARCEGYVVIGRRDGARTDKEKRRLADFREQHIEVASYDRLVYEARDHLGLINESAAEAARNAGGVEAIKARPEKDSEAG